MFTVVPAAVPSPLMTHDEVFRGCWLPQVASELNFLQLPTALLRDLHADVYTLGPYAAEWWALLGAVEVLVARLTAGAAPGQGVPLLAAFVEDLHATYGYDAAGHEVEIASAFNQYGPHALGMYVDPTYLVVAMPWVQGLGNVWDSPAFQSRLEGLYAAGLNTGAGVSKNVLWVCFEVMAQVVVMRCLPVAAGHDGCRERVWSLHDAFMARWGLPLLLQGL